MRKVRLKALAGSVLVAVMAMPLYAGTDLPGAAPPPPGPYLSSRPVLPSSQAPVVDRAEPGLFEPGPTSQQSAQGHVPHWGYRNAMPMGNYQPVPPGYYSGPAYSMPPRWEAAVPQPPQRHQPPSGQYGYPQQAPGGWRW